MYKDSKLNKSPIDSILQESFGHLPSSSVHQTGDDAHEDNRSNTHSETKEFKVSHENVNANIQLQLQFARMISTARLEIALTALTSILANKYRFVNGGCSMLKPTVSSGSRTDKAHIKI